MNRLKDQRLVLVLWWQDGLKAVKTVRSIVGLCRHAWRAAWDPLPVDSAHEDVLDSLAWMTAMVGAGWQFSPEAQEARAVLDAKGLPRCYVAQMRLTAALLASVPVPDDHNYCSEACAHAGSQLEHLQAAAACIHATRAADLERQARMMALHPSAS